MSKFSFRTSVLTFYLKGNITVEPTRTSLVVPNTILKFIPLGQRSFMVPVEQISAVNTSFSLDLKTMLIGAFVALLGLSAIGDSFLLGLILMLFGVAQVISALSTVLQIEKTSGAALTIPFVIFDKQVAYDVAEVMNASIMARTNDTNTRVHSEHNADRIVDAINGRQ